MFCFAVRLLQISLYIHPTKFVCCWLDRLRLVARHQIMTRLPLFYVVKSKALFPPKLRPQSMSAGSKINLKAYVLWLASSGAKTISKLQYFSTHIRAREEQFRTQTIPGAVILYVERSAMNVCPKSHQTISTSSTLDWSRQCTCDCLLSKNVIKHCHVYNKDGLNVSHSHH